jgi:hypothetical protein
MDSEMDAQEMLNGFGGGFAEGESDIIDEEEGADEHNNSMDVVRTSKHKKPKSLDDFDGEEEPEEIQDKEEFFRNLSSNMEKPSLKRAVSS